MERDSVTCPVKRETTTDFQLETVNNACLSCDLGSASEAQSLPHFNDGQEDPKPYQCAKSPPDCIFPSSDLVPLTAAHSEDVPLQSYQGGSSSAVLVVESPSDNFDQQQVDRSPSRSKDNSAGKYQCKHCFYQTEKLQHFKVHRMIHTGEKPYLCEQCAYKADYKSHLKAHERIHSGVKPFACKQCSYTTVHKGNLKEHERKHSAVKPFACIQCSYKIEVKEESLEDQIEYLLHYAQLHNDPTAALKVLELEVLLMDRDSVTCPVKLKTTTDFKLETVDNKCLSCDLGSVSKAQSVPHSNDRQENPKSAETPPDNLFSSSDLVPLTAAHSEDVPSQGYQGGSSSAEPVVESHSENCDQDQAEMSPSRFKYWSTGNYHCEDCSYESSELNSFKAHRMIHTGVKPFACKQCSYTTTRKSALNAHERRHSEVKPFACKQYSYTTARKSALKAHERTHSGVKPFACNQCSYTITTIRNLVNLKLHARTHFGVKPFACNRCSYTTVHKGNLKEHERKHFAVKPFACIQCSYTTAYKGSLKSHARKHSAVKPFACSQCSYTIQLIWVI